MSISWGVVRENIKFLVALLRPSFAKALSVPLLVAGIGILNPPLWLNILNWFLSNQRALPEYSEPISTPMYITGWVLIGLSILIYLIDVWRQIKSMRQDSEKKLLDVVKDHPKKTADLVLSELQSTGFTAQHLQDEKIDKLLHEITSLRFFGSFPKEEKATALAQSVFDGELFGGTPQAKARALALLARYLCVGERVDQAKTWLSSSKKLCQTEESVIAQAFFDAIRSNDVEAASGLLKAGGPSNYAAFFMIKKTVEGCEAALEWFKKADLHVSDFDNDGKVSLLSILLKKNYWERALKITQEIDEEILVSSPALAQRAALSVLVNAVKSPDLRETVLADVPFASFNFPLADDEQSLGHRNRSVLLFKACSKAAKEFGAESVANHAYKYVMWLELRNRETHEQAKAQLQSYFDSYTQKTLEYLPLAFAFGIDFDSVSIENEVNRQTALGHDNDPILGLARFVLAQTKKSFTAVVEYIASHRHQLEKSVNPVAVGMLEVEALARSGLVNDAEQLLQKIEGSGAPEAEVRNLQHIIETVKGTDPLALAICQYQQSNLTSDLIYLVNLLESKKENRGDKYYSYCRELFERTSQESDAIRVCDAATSIGKFSEVHQFLTGIMDVVRKSEGLQTHLAWSLFRKGDLRGSRELLDQLKQAKPTDSSLREALI